jgi:hypothetical protein
MDSVNVGIWPYTVESSLPRFLSRWSPKTVVKIDDRGLARRRRS